MSDSLLAAGETTEATEAPETTESTEAPPSTEGELLLGKYKTADDLANAYKELEKKLGSNKESLREELMAELQADAYKDRPATAGDYQLPESVDGELAVDNKLLQWWSDHAFENGYSQEEFEQGIAMYAEAVIGNQPNLEAEAKKLGDNANDRIKAASMFASKFFPEAAMPAIERMCESHEGILALEAIMEATKDGSFSGATVSASGVSEQSLQEMMRDPRYFDPSRRDPHFVKQVEDGFRKLYG